MIDGIKTAGEATAKLAKDATEKLNNTESKVDQFIGEGRTLFNDFGAFFMQGIDQKPSDQLTRMDINALLANLKNEPTNIPRVARVFEGLGNLQKAEVDQVLPEVLGQVSALVQHNSIANHADRQVKEQSQLIQALVAVKNSLPTDHTATDYTTKFEDAVTAQAKALGSNVQAQLTKLRTETADTLPKKLATVFRDELKELQDLTSRKSILPYGWELSSTRNYSDQVLASFKGRVFDGAKAGEALNQDVANTILTIPGLYSDPDLLGHLAGTLADPNSPLAKSSISDTNAVEVYLPFLIGAAKDYANGIASAAGATLKNSEVLAGKVQKVLAELDKSADGTQTIDTLVASSGLEKVADIAYLNLMLNHHTHTAAAPKLTPAQQLTYIKDQLGKIAAAVKADNPPPPILA